MLLIALGIGGLGVVIASSAVLTFVARWGGAAFLLVYGFLSFRSAYRGGSEVNGSSIATPDTLKATVMAALAFTFLNPHVYLDSVVLIGTIGAQHPAAERPWFAAGAMSASVVWFFGLAYGAAQLAPVLDKPATARVLDAVIGIVMWSIAVSLIFG